MAGEISRDLYVPLNTSYTASRFRQNKNAIRYHLKDDIEGRAGLKEWADELLAEEGFRHPDDPELHTLNVS